MPGGVSLVRPKRKPAPAFALRPAPFRAAFRFVGQSVSSAKWARLLGVQCAGDESTVYVHVYPNLWPNCKPISEEAGRTPQEVYDKLRAANGAPQFEPRSRWPRASPCARPQTLIKGQPGVRFELVVTHHKGRAHLPVVTLLRGA
jgi:hypothetical protein